MNKLALPWLHFLRSLEGTSSCESGRSAVVTLRCNPDMSTQGTLSVPRYYFLLFPHLMPSLQLKISLTLIVAIKVANICAVFNVEVMRSAFGHSSQCPEGTCDGCTFHFFWESSGACPTCTARDYHLIEGVCKGGQQVCFCVSMVLIIGEHFFWPFSLTN